MSRPLLLDLFCGGGGAGMGYFRAGFDVIGVDLHKQKNYPFPFVQADALNPPFDLSRFDAIHASPPCQAFSVMKHLSKACNGGNYPVHPDLLDKTRKMLVASGRPYVIENVPGSPIKKQITLCGKSFGLKVYRHRHFESNVLIMSPTHEPHYDQSPGAGNGLSPKGFITATRQGGIRGMKEAEIVSYIKGAMEIDWMNRSEMGEAIPPAYTEFIGRQLIETVVR